MSSFSANLVSGSALLSVVVVVGVAGGTAPLLGPPLGITHAPRATSSPARRAGDSPSGGDSLESVEPVPNTVESGSVFSDSSESDESVQYDGATSNPPPTEPSPAPRKVGAAVNQLTDFKDMLKKNRDVFLGRNPMSRRPSTANMINWLQTAGRLRDAGRERVWRGPQINLQWEARGRPAVPPPPAVPPQPRARLSSPLYPPWDARFSRPAPHGPHRAPHRASHPPQRPAMANPYPAPPDAPPQAPYLPRVQPTLFPRRPNQNDIQQNMRKARKRKKKKNVKSNLKEQQIQSLLNILNEGMGRGGPSPAPGSALGRELRMRADQHEEELEEHGNLEDLDLAPARGDHIDAMRERGRICQRNVMVVEGPKYNSKGKVYLEAYNKEQHDDRPFDQTKAPKFVIPACCNCCVKSVFGCE